MDRKSTENMRLDRRLIGRRNWISEEELKQKLDELPDVSDKIAVDQDAPDDASESGAEEPEGPPGSDPILA